MDVERYRGERDRGRERQRKRAGTKWETGISMSRNGQFVLKYNFGRYT